MNVNSICHYPFTTVRLASDGNVFLCQYQRKHIGNLIESSFEEIWFGEKAEECRQKLVQSEYSELCCVNCPFYSSKQKAKQQVGYSEYPNVLELFDELNQTENFEYLLPKIKDYKEILIDFKYHNEIKLPDIPVTMNLTEDVYPTYVSTFRIVQCDNLSKHRFLPDKKYICKYTFKLGQLNKICDIVEYFLQHPFSVIECDIDTEEVTVDTCGLFKRAELLLNNRFKKCRRIRPFDLNMSKKFIL